MSIFRRNKVKLEGRGDKPDTLKPDIDEATKTKAPEKPKPVVEKIPDDTVKIITDLKAKKNQLVNQFLNLSFQVGELKDKQNETRNKVKSTNEQISQKVNYAFDKLRLKKRKNYRWSFDAKNNSFIGTLIPEPKKVEGIKK